MPSFEAPHGWTVWGALLVTGIFASALAFLVQTWAQRRTTATQTAVVFTLEPVWAALFGYWLAGDRLGARGVGRLRRDPGRHRARRARGGRADRAPAVRPRARLSAVVLALASAAAFGAMTTAIRLGLRGGGSTLDISLATVTVGFALTLAASFVRHDYRNAWAFFLTGLLAPGLSQILFTRSIEEVGASRTSVAAGTAPLFALAIAFTFLDEPVEATLVAGALLIVAGGTLLVAERDRPGHLRARGILFALVAAVIFAVRDNIVRALHTDGSPETVAAATMLAGVVVGLVTARRLPSRRSLRSLAPAGLLFGFSYLCLFEAYFRGRVSVVSPLVATESLWGVGTRGARLPGLRGHRAPARARRGRDRRRWHADRGLGGLLGSAIKRLRFSQF